jgi:hypothetical protein
MNSRLRRPSPTPSPVLARSDCGVRWPSWLVATKAEDRLNIWHNAAALLTPTEPDPTAGRQSRIVTLVFLVALVVAGFVVGLVWWPELMPWGGR